MPSPLSPTLPRHLLYTVGSGFLLSLLLIIAMSLSGLSALTDANRNLEHIVGSVTQKTREVNELRDILHDRILTMHTIVILRDPFARELMMQRFYQIGGDYIRTRAKLNAYTHTSREQTLLNHIDALTLENQPIITKTVDLAIEDHTLAAFDHLQKEGLPRQQRLIVLLDQLVLIQQQIAHQATQNAERAFIETRNLMFLLGVLALALSGVVALFILKRIRRLAGETEQARTRYQTLFETNSDGIVIVGQRGFIGCNPAALTMFGFNDEAQFLATRPMDLGSDPQPDGRAAPKVAQDFIGTAFSTGHASLNWEAKRTDGTTFPAEIALHAMHFEGTPTLQAIIRDITPQREAEQAIQAAHTAALATATLKTQFIANISHEIRTPMNGIVGLTDLLQRQPLSEPQAAYVRAIHDSAGSLTHLLNDLLDFSKLTAGRMQIEHIPFDLPALLSSVALLSQHRAEHAGLQFHLDLPDTLPHGVIGDPQRLRQILINLLDNALKFTAHGTIRLVITQSHASDPAYLLFSVQDTGIGIPDAAKVHIFDPFIQADGSVSRRFGGTGLGLAICRELAEKMGGQLWHTAPSDTPGSHFNLELRLEGTTLPTPTSATAALQPPFSGLRVLVAEDHPINQLLIRDMLIALGAQPTLAADGQAAVEVYRDNPFDLILMDYQMPILDGLSAARQIRRLEADTHRPRCPIIALTANAQDDFAEACTAAGLDAQLAKPIHLEHLQTALVRALGQTPAPTPPSPARPHPASAHLVTLFIETTQSDLAALSTHLTEQNPQIAAQLAHRIRGAAAFIGDATGAEYAHALERVLTQATDPAHWTDALERLQTHISQLKNTR
ncbi:MAG: response regulator [Betaproteobacteria bacterium]|nr:MAG: response regulator [Betaproteobacteria bacterium]